MTLGVDWLSVIVPAHNLARVRRLGRRYWGTPEDQPRGTLHYESACRWEGGAVLAWTEGRSDCWLSVNGSSLCHLSGAMLLKLFRQLDALGARGTRIDLRADLPPDLLSVGQVEQAAAAGQVFPFKRCDPRKPIKDLRRGTLEGHGIYFGRRGSDGSGCFVRVYDKALESKGEIVSTRLEPEFSGDKAAKLFDILASSFTLDRFVEKIAAHIGGCIEFLDRGGHRHKKRMKVLDWWANVLAVLGSAQIQIRRAVPPLQSSMRWVRKCLGRTINVFIDVVNKQGHDGRAVLMAMIDAEAWRAVGYRPGARDLDIDVGALLA